MVAEKTAGSILPALYHPTEGFLRPRLAFMGEKESRRTPGSFATEEPAALATGTDTHSLCHPGSILAVLPNRMFIGEGDTDGFVRAES